eukprot:28923_5
MVEFAGMTAFWRTAKTGSKGCTLAGLLREVTSSHIERGDCVEYPRPTNMLRSVSKEGDSDDFFFWWTKQVWKAMVFSFVGAWLAIGKDCIVLGQNLCLDKEIGKRTVASIRTCTAQDDFTVARQIDCACLARVIFQFHTANFKGVIQRNHNSCLGLDVVFD